MIRISNRMESHDVCDLQSNVDTSRPPGTIATKASVHRMNIQTKLIFPLLSLPLLLIAGCSTGPQRSARHARHSAQPISHHLREELSTNVEENKSEIDAVLNDRSRWIDGNSREF